ncbi:MAG: AzlD domain-containing protein [Pseudobutyrivibrio sp.]|nr:AzlD domain-containing protein [Pseudobutyrivibrio sp.]
MMTRIYIYILIAALVSTIIRVLPVTIFRKPIKNRFVRSFLYYVPFVTLAVMTFPAIIDATQVKLAGILALIVGTIAAWFRQSLFTVAVLCCVVVFLVELIPIL